MLLASYLSPTLLVTLADTTVFLIVDHQSYLFRLFDSHAHDSSGQVDELGMAIVMYFTSNAKLHTRQDKHSKYMKYTSKHSYANSNMINSTKKTKKN